MQKRKDEKEAQLLKEAGGEPLFPKANSSNVAEFVVVKRELVDEGTKEVQ